MLPPNEHATTVNVGHCDDRRRQRHRIVIGHTSTFPWLCEVLEAPDRCKAIT